MPEGPEARTIADKLRPYIRNKVIYNTFKDERSKTLGWDNLKCPAMIIEVRSHAKKVIIDLDTGHMIIASLGMSGRFQYNQGNHSHIRLDICEHRFEGPFHIIYHENPVCSLWFDDTRYMGSIDIIPNISVSLYFRDMGPDLLQAALDEKTWISLETWISIFTQKKLLKRAICDVIMDQSLIGGIGWYLQTEILYYAGVHPERLIESITTEEWDRIRISAHKVILLSYSYGGFTIESFISPDGSLGLYPAAVYGKKHDPTGNEIISEKLTNGRTSHWVPAIQH